MIDIPTRESAAVFGLITFYFWLHWFPPYFYAGHLVLLCALTWFYCFSSILKAPLSLLNLDLELGPKQLVLTTLPHLHLCSSNQVLIHSFWCQYLSYDCLLYQTRLGWPEVKQKFNLWGVSDWFHLIPASL